MNECNICNDVNCIQDIVTNVLPQSLRWRLIKETKHFIVTPTLGPIVDGYVIIWPKRHILSFKHLVEDELSELVTIVDSLCDTMKGKFNKELVVFEHGQVEGCNEVGCGVNHAHIHIVAIDNTRLFFDMAQSTYITEKEYEKYYDFYQDGYFPNKDYMLISSIDFSETKILSYGEIRVSQALRRILAECCGQSGNWNWREFMNIPSVISIANALGDRKSVNKELLLN